MNLANLFSTPIALFDDVYIDPEEVARAAISDVGTSGTPSGWMCDIRSSYKTTTRFADTIPAFKQAILNAARQYSIKYWGGGPSIEKSWTNVAGTGQYQEQHNHIGCQFSGVYYPQIQSGEAIIFHCPYTAIASINHSLQTATINLKPNRLILFPAYLEHSFRAMQRETEKVSVAFNFRV